MSIEYRIETDNDGAWLVAPNGARGRVCTTPGPDILMWGRLSAPALAGCGAESCRTAWKQAIAGEAPSSPTRVIAGWTADPGWLTADEVPADQAAALGQALVRLARELLGSGTDLRGALAAVSADPWGGTPPTNEEISAVTGKRD